MNRPKRRTAFSAVELTAASAMIALLMSVALPALQIAREDARRVACKGKLHMIGLALHNYHDVYAAIPPAWVRPDWSAPSEAGHAWLTRILPFVDLAPMYNEVDFNTPPVADIHPYNLPVTAYRCPSDTMAITNPVRGGFPTANYSGNFGRTPPPRWLPAQTSEFWPGTVDTPREVNGVMCCNSRIGFRDIKDGASNTFMVGERCVTTGAAIWPAVNGSQNENDAVSDCSHGSWLNTGYSSFSSLHPGGANFLLCDGSVRFVADTIDSVPASAGRLGMYQRLADRDDGEQVKF